MVSFPERSHCGWIKRKELKGNIEVCNLIVDHADMHYHKKADQLYFVIKGDGLLKFNNGESISLKEGNCYPIPAGVKHRPVEFRNLEILVISTSPTENDTHF